MDIKGIIDEYTNGFQKKENIDALIHFGGSYVNDVWYKSDIDFIAIDNNQDKPVEIFSRDKRDIMIHINLMSADYLLESLQSYDNPKFCSLIAESNVLFDKSGEVTKLLAQTMSNHGEYLKLNIFKEFCQLLKKYYRSKKFFEKDKPLDSYRQLLDSMVHWAKIVIYEQGQYPKQDVWSQVYDMNLGVFKLYEELLFNREPLTKRIELMQLVYLNNVISRIRAYCSPLLEFFKGQVCPLSYRDIKNHSRFNRLNVDFHIVLDELVRQGVLFEDISLLKGLSNDSVQVKEIRYGIKNR
ncbi:MAG: hypothetical protein ACOYEJ_01155 [Mahellales bacterium]